MNPVFPGNFVLVPVGFAITRVGEEEAARTCDYLARLNEIAAEPCVSIVEMLAGGQLPRIR